MNKMVVLGLGTNLGDKLNNLRKALHAIKSDPAICVAAVSPLYLSDALLPEHAPAAWDMPHINLAIRCTTSYRPHDLLAQLKKIEKQIGRKFNSPHWGPREIDIDILVWDDLILHDDVLHIPHAGLFDRPFALWGLADVAPFWKNPLSSPHETAAQLVEKWGSRFNGLAPFRTRQLNQRVDTAAFVGILNVTPDSFSDGDHFINPEMALKKITHLIEDGAEIIDVGAESTSPHAQPIDAQTEWLRLQGVLEIIKAHKKNFILPPKISIDTRHAYVAKCALHYEIDWINDVSGLDDKAMRAVVATSQKDVVVMHHLCIPERRDNVLARDADVVKEVMVWGKNRLQTLEKAGINVEKIIFDPGIGFGKMAEQSLELLKKIDLFSALGMRLLVGHSRKTFLNLFSNKPFHERDPETAVIALFCAKHVDFIRVHNVKMCAMALKVAAQLET